MSIEASAQPTQPEVGYTPSMLHDKFIQFAESYTTDYEDEGEQTFTAVDVVKALAKANDRTILYGQSQRQEAAIFGADSIEVGSVNVASEEPTPIMFVELFKDGSPFVLDSDYQAGLDSNDYAILAPSDGPAVLVNFSDNGVFLEKYRGFADAYLKGVELGVETGRFLSASETTTIATMLNNLAARLVPKTLQK